MYKSLTLFEMAGALSTHAGRAQVITARNIANADTPGYRAQRLTPFAESYRTEGTLSQIATREKHLTTAPLAARHSVQTGKAVAPNGNGVLLEREMMASVEASRAHSRALSIYRHGMTVLRLSLGRAS